MSFEQLKQIVEDAKHEDQRQRNEPPTACPIDGEPLDIGSNGIRNCPMGNYRWPS